jgi:hypothetical protein
MAQPARKKDTGSHRDEPRTTDVDDKKRTSRSQPEQEGEEDKRSKSPWLMATLVFGLPFVLLVALGMLSSRC